MLSWFELVKKCVIKYRELEKKKLQEEFDLTVTQYELIKKIPVTGIIMKEITLKSKTTKGSTSVIIKRLLKKGYLQAKEEEDDKRTKLICRTTTGKNAIEEMEIFNREFVKRSIEGLKTCDCDKCAVFFKKIDENLQKMIF